MFSGVLALTILSSLCLIYYNPPIAVAQPDGYTNFKFEPDSSWSFMTEGNGRGSINSLGYNDPQNLETGKKSICFLGSSHTEALQVDMEKNFVSLLEAMINSDEVASNDYQCLNLGVSGHSFGVVASNFQNFANSFEQVDYVVIETDNIEFSEEELEKMLNEEYHSDLGTRSFAHEFFQKIPYMRLLVKQYNESQKSSSSSVVDMGEAQSFANYAMRLDPIMDKLSEISQENHFELIILHHNPVSFDENNQAYAQYNAESQEQFQRSCQSHGIRYLNTNDSFCRHANTHTELPYGFSNTCFGAGHLNEVGHQLIAELLYSELFSAKEG